MKAGRFGCIPISVARQRKEVSEKCSLTVASRTCRHHADAPNEGGAVWGRVAFLA
jgi:hypothetical protein